MIKQSVIPQTDEEIVDMVKKLPPPYKNIVKGMVLGLLASYDNQRSA